MNQKLDEEIRNLALEIGLILSKETQETRIEYIEKVTFVLMYALNDNFREYCDNSEEHSDIRVH